MAPKGLGISLSQRCLFVRQRVAAELQQHQELSDTVTDGFVFNRQGHDFRTNGVELTNSKVAALEIPINHGLEYEALLFGSTIAKINGAGQCGDGDANEFFRNDSGHGDILRRSLEKNRFHSLKDFLGVVVPSSSKDRNQEV